MLLARGRGGWGHLEYGSIVKTIGPSRASEIYSRVYLINDVNVLE